MTAAKRIILCLWLVLLGVAHAPAAVLDASENRVWKKIDAPQQTRLVESSQVTGSHQENSLPPPGIVLGCCLAAKGPTIPAGLMDEAARLQSQWGSQMAELAQSGQPLNMIQPKMVNLSRLNPPVTRPFADPLKLQRHGPFDMSKYTPIIAEERNGVLTIQDGMTRWQNAQNAGIQELPVLVFPSR